MANRKTRKIAKRRDRRKAKASGWRRMGKSSMTPKIGHGVKGSMGTKTCKTKRWYKLTTQNRPPILTFRLSLPPLSLAL